MASSTKSALYWTCTPELNVTKPTLIFLHASWMSSTMFEETISHLKPILPSTNFLCIDGNGHGATVYGRKNFTLWDQAHDIVALMDELNIPKAIFVGMSMGSLIALRIALAHPSRVEALVLLAGTATAATPESIAGITQMRDIWVSTPAPSEEIMNAAIRAWGGDPDVEGPRSRRIKRDWVERYSGTENVDPVLESMNVREDIRGRLGEVKVKVLIVHGEEDQGWKVEEAEMVRDGMVNAEVRFEVIRGSGHLVIWMRDSEDVSGMIGEFVREVVGI